MSCKTLHLINQEHCLAIIQGETYTKLTILKSGDFSDAIPYGTIRDNYEDKNGIELAIFSFFPLTYNLTTDKTTIAPFLSKEITRSLPMTKFQANEDEIPTVKNCLVYEIGLTLLTGENIVLISSSFIQVIPHT